MISSLLDSMLFLIAMDLPSVSEAVIQEYLPLASSSEVRLIASDIQFKEDLPLEPFPREPLKATDNSLEKVAPLDSSYEIAPIILEGTVENFDPVGRASKLSKNLYLPHKKALTR